MARNNIHIKWNLHRYVTDHIWCDSILTLDLMINDSYSLTTVPMTACDSMEWQGTTYTVSGIYYDTLQTLAVMIV